MRWRRAPPGEQNLEVARVNFSPSLLIDLHHPDGPSLEMRGAQRIERVLNWSCVELGGEPGVLLVSFTMVGLPVWPPSRRCLRRS